MTIYSIPIQDFNFKIDISDEGSYIWREGARSSYFYFREIFKYDEDPSSITLDEYSLNELKNYHTLYLEAINKFKKLSPFI